METMREVIAANRAAGHHWFDRDTMRFFRTRLCPATVTALPDGGALFVASDVPPHGPRAYAVRRAHADGSVETLGVVCEFRTRAQAIAALKHAMPHIVFHHGVEVWSSLTKGVDP